MKKSSWGLLSNEEHNVIHLTNRFTSSEVVCKNFPGITYGNGRSYGDVCLNPNGNLWDTSGLSKYIHFDDKNGMLHCESGTLLKDINNVTIPRGWMLPVTPGTQLGTVGGSIANDIHGKNHHKYASFGNHLCEINLLRTNGEMIKCGPNLNKEMFLATIGGIGLTGIIISAIIKLKKIESAYIESENIPYTNLEDFFNLSDESEDLWEHNVSWLDCTSKNNAKGIFTRGNFVNDFNYDFEEKLNFKFPFKPKFSLINKASLNIFNQIYFQAGRLKSKKFVSSFNKSLYPLDSILEWNKIYGTNGFRQYQSVIPKKNRLDATKEMLRIIKSSGEGSFLAVLKTFGNKKSIGMLSFPVEGVTLALDFPSKGENTIKLFSKLDKVVSEAGGRIYMAKDSCMTPEMFEIGYPKFREFLEYRDDGVSSSMSRRLLGS